MDAAEQTAAFQRDLEKLIERYREEFDLSIAEAVGTLELVKLDLWHEHLEPVEDDDDDDDG